jgi:hypothetical protein
MWTANAMRLNTQIFTTLKLTRISRPCVVGDGGGWKQQGEESKPTGGYKRYPKNVGDQWSESHMPNYVRKLID